MLQLSILYNQVVGNTIIGSFVVIRFFLVRLYQRFMQSIVQDSPISISVI
jgi:hypothetical protein